MAPTLTLFLNRIRAGEPLAFNDAMGVISAHYDYTPTRFKNGLGEDSQVNEPGTNEGSCKLFSFARLHGFNEAETLSLFGDYYRKDVLGNSEGTDHKNIRNFMKHGWAGIRFDEEALSPRKT